MNWQLDWFEPGVVAVVGPTAIGKTALSIELARQWKCPIVSADAFQVYRGFDIGTAKVPKAIMTEIPHYGVDCCDPTASFSVGAFQSVASPLIKTAVSTDTPLLVCGGTGLYIQSVLFDYSLPDFPVDPSIRSALQAEWLRHGSPWMWQRLAAIDPRAAADIHPNHNRRIIRALEICMASGRPLHETRSQSSQRSDIQVVGLRTDKSRHWEWIRNRVVQMIEDGLIDEVQCLRARFGTTVPAFKAVGYPETVAFLDGMIPTQDDLIDQIVIRTRQLAKRQLTWFKRLAHVKWIDPA